MGAAHQKEKRSDINGSGTLKGKRKEPIKHVFPFVLLQRILSLVSRDR